MAYNTAPGRAEYVASAGQTLFTYTFKAYVSANIKVYLTPVGQDPNDANDILTETTDYTVTIDGDNGGTITLVVPATLGDAVTFVRDLANTRSIEYQELGDLFAETLNDDQDYQTYLISDQETSSSRFVSIPASAQNISTELPSVVADSYIRWNSTGDALENDTTIPDSVSDAAASAAAAATSETNAAGSASAAATSETNALNSQNFANKWATEEENVPVNDGVNPEGFSAFHYAQKAISGGTERTSARNTAISASASGVLALATTPTPSFNTVIYTGNGTSQNIVTGLESSDPNWVSAGSYTIGDIIIHDYYIYTALTTHSGVATTPDLDTTNWSVVADGVSVPFLNSQVWIKIRNSTNSHGVYNTLTGVTNVLHSDTTAAEATLAGSVTAFNSDGITVGNNNDVNASTFLYVAWQEQFDTMVSGTTNQGKRYITAYNAQSGKGMTIYVGSGTAGHEIPHGLGTKLDFINFKNRDAIVTWVNQGSYLDYTAGEFLALDTNAAVSSGATVETSLSDTTVTLATTTAYNALNQDHVAYFSSNRDNHTVTKMYQGTGAAGNTNANDLGLNMTQAGAKFTIKPLSATGGWIMYDGTRGETAYLFADSSNAEAVLDFGSFTSTGVIIDSTNANLNSAGVTYLIEATVPNYDKPTGGLDIPSGSVISYAEGTDGTTGDLDSIETTTLHSDLSMTANAKNYIYLDKGNVASTSIYPLLKQLDSTLDANSPIYNVGEGEVYDTGGVQKSRVILGEVIADGEGLVIPDTLVEYPVAHQDVTSMEVHGNAKFHGDIEGKQICTAWVNFDGTTTPPTIRDSYNVSDVVRTATGQFEVYFETSMDNTNYSAQCTSINADNIGTAQVYNIDNVFVLNHDVSAVGYSNPSSYSVQIFGGKA